MLRSLTLLSRIGLTILVAGIVGVGVGLALQPAAAPAHADGRRLHVPVVIPDVVRSDDMLGVTDQNCPAGCPNIPSVPPTLPPVELVLAPGIRRFQIVYCGFISPTVSFKRRLIGAPCFTGCNTPTGFCSPAQLSIVTSVCYLGNNEVSVPVPPEGQEFVLVVENGSATLVCEPSPN